MSKEIVDKKDLYVNFLKSELDKIEEGENLSKASRFILAALGSIPWVGGFLSASASLNGEQEQSQINNLHRLWLQNHEVKIEDLGKSISNILARIDTEDEEVKKRIESKDYLQLVSKGYRIWDKSDTEEKRELIIKLLTNSAATKLCSDDVVRLFLDWIEKYHDSHFYIIKYIYQNPGISRGQIWDMIYPSRPSESSSEADLYKLLIRDLSTGGVIRQHRPTTYRGEFITKKPAKKSKSRVMKSAFDDQEPYELTELGQKFVHYSMTDIVKKIE